MTLCFPEELVAPTILVVIVGVMSAFGLVTSLVERRKEKHERH